MKYEMSKTKEWLLIITLFIANIIVMEDMVIIPTASMLYSMFPDGTSYVNFAMTGCYIFIVIFSLVVGRLLKRFDKKALLLFGALSGLGGGLIMMFNVTAPGIAIGRGLLMIAYAFSYNVAVAIISDMYADDSMRRGKIIGYFHAACSATGAVLSVAVGVLAVKSLFAAYSLLIPYVIMILLFVPSMKPDRKAIEAEESETQKEKAASGKKEGFGFHYWMLLLTFSIFTLAFCIPLFYVSVYVSENSIGGTALAGTLSTVITVCGFCTGMLFSRIKGLLKDKAVLIFCICAALACASLVIKPCLAVAFIGFGVQGAANPFIKTNMYNQIPDLVPESRVGDAIANCTSIAIGLGMITAYFVTYGMQLLHFETLTSFLIIPVVIYVTCAVLDIYLRSVVRKKKAAENQEI